MSRVPTSKQIISLKSHIESKMISSGENIQLHSAKTQESVGKRGRCIEGSIEKTRKAISLHKSEAPSAAEMLESLQQHTKSLQTLYTSVDEELAFDEVSKFYSDYMKSIDHEFRSKIG